MLTTLLTRLMSAWQKRESPAVRWALVTGTCAILAVVAHAARSGTGSARGLAALGLVGALSVTVALMVRGARHWRDERQVLRKILRAIDKDLGARAERAYDVVRQTHEDTALGSPELARHHYHKLLRQASLDAVHHAASKRATRWRWLALTAFGTFLALIVPDPMRFVEGFDVLVAHRGRAPVELTFVDLKRVTVKPPSYLREPVRSAMLGVSGRFATGSTVVLQGRPRYEGRALVLTDGVTEVPFVSDGHAGIVANWTLKSSTTLWVASRYGEVTIPEPERLPLEAIADQTPKVWVEGAPKSVRLKDIETLDIRYRAEDDHGIRQVDLVISSGKRDSRRVLLKLDAEDREASGGYSLEASDDTLKRMFLPVHISVEAKDDDPITGPKWGQSAAIVVLPPVVGEPEAERFTALEAARNQLVDVLALYSEPAAEAASERQEQLKRRRTAQQKASDAFKASLDRTYAGLEVPAGMKNFVLGQLKVLKRPPRPGVSAERQLQDAVLAIDVALSRLATREARSVAILLADVVEDAAEGAKQAREIGAQDKGLRRLEHSGRLALEGAAQLAKLGVLGADLGSVAQGDLGRVDRAKRQQAFMEAERAARHLADRLRRPNPSFGASGQGGVESGSPGQRPPQGEPSESDQQFDQLAQELEQLAQEHARGLSEVEEALEQAEKAIDDSALRAEAQERANAIRRSVANLPEVGADPGSSRAAAALAREHARAMASNLERLELDKAVESGEQAMQALREAEAKSNQGSLADWLDPQELKQARARLEQDLEWAKAELQKQKAATERAAREGLDKASQRERELAERAGNLSGRGKNDQTPLPEDVLRRLDRAEELMREAARELREGSAEKGLSLQQDAQRLLEQARTGKTSDKGESRRSEASDDGGNDLRTGGEVPDPNAANEAADFRDRVLRGLGREREGRLAPAVKRYAEELLR
ncbi:MAG TPA: DUF4175 domain-containing protein [Polyangiaceae bacterium]